MIEPTLDLATAGDAAEIAALYLASRADAMPGLAWVHGADSTRFWIKAVMLAQGRTWVARRNGEILGFLNLVGDEVTQLYLKPGHYREGIGSRLLDQAKAASPGRLRLHTFQRNRRAQAFYEAHGFRIVERTDGMRNEEREPDMLYEWREVPEFP